MGLQLANARYFWHDGYPLLAVDINGEEARFGPEWRPTLRAAGLVGIDLDLGLPDRTIPTLDGQGLVTVSGCTDDKRLVELYRRFCLEQDFQPGPVEIPSA